MNKFQAAIFDLDGLLIDSMKYWIDLDNDFFKRFDIQLTEVMIKQLTGRSEQENMLYFKEKFNLLESVDELLAIREQSCTSIYTHKTAIMPGAGQLITRIKQSGLKQAIASGAPLRHIEIAVRRFNWQGYFTELFSVDHVNFVGKPDPVIFLHSARVLGVRPEECVVFEDAENGVTAAKRAGMACVAVPNEQWSFGDFSRADLIANSLEDKKILNYLGL